MIGRPKKLTQTKVRDIDTFYLCNKAEFNEFHLMEGLHLRIKMSFIILAKKKLNQMLIQTTKYTSHAAGNQANYGYVYRARFPYKRSCRYS